MIEVDNHGFTAWLGMQFDSYGDGYCRCWLDLADQHRNVYGVAHGGVTYSLLDTAMGVAVWSLLQEGERTATVEIKVTYCHPVSDGRLVAQGRVVERTRQLAFTSGEVRTADGKLVVMATGTFYIYRQAADVQA
jgi:acyl-CoA thioesterase